MELLLPIASNDCFIAKCHKILYSTVCLCNMRNDTNKFCRKFIILIWCLRLCACMFYSLIYRFWMCEQKFRGKILIIIIRNNDCMNGVKKKQRLWNIYIFPYFFMLLLLWYVFIRNCGKWCMEIIDAAACNTVIVHYNKFASTLINISKNQNNKSVSVGCGMCVFIRNNNNEGSHCALYMLSVTVYCKMLFILCEYTYR